MGQTVCVKTGLKDVNILEKALQGIFGWNNIQKLTPQQEQEGKSLKASLYGGVGEGPIVLKVDKKDLKDKEGRPAIFSDFAVTRNPDGKLDMKTDLHNFDRRDVIPFVTEEMIAEVKAKYGQTAIDAHQETYSVDITQDWQENGEWMEKKGLVDEDEIQNIPQANYL